MGKTQKKTSSKKNTFSSEEVIQSLSRFVANTAVLYVKTLNFHWNMKGPQFYMYHKLLEEQYKELAEALDDLAERIQMLGGKSPGTLKQFLSLSSLEEPSSSLSQNQMIKDLVQSHETMAFHSRSLIQLGEKHEDEGTIDLIIERLRSHDKAAWLLRSHLEN